MKDGSVLVGKVTQIVDQTLYISTQFAGDLEIPLEHVEMLNTEESLPVHLSDGSVIVGTVKESDNGQIVVQHEQTQTEFQVNPSDIQAINPPQPTPTPKPKWKGKIVGSLSSTDGNSDTLGGSFTTELTKRSEADRITLRGGYFYEEDNGEGTRDEQFVFGKYDYFFNQKMFGYLNSRLDRDSIKDLQLRTSGGVGAGYQFIENETWNIFSETGLSYVNEDFELDADDATYVAGRAAFHAGWWIVQEKLQFEEDAELLLGIEDIDDWFAISDSSLTWYWSERWSSQAALRYEYDNTPATGKKNWDLNVTLGLGYSF